MESKNAHKNGKQAILRETALGDYRVIIILKRSQVSTFKNVFMITYVLYTNACNSTNKFSIVE